MPGRHACNLSNKLTGLEEQFACHLKLTLYVISKMDLSALCVCIYGIVRDIMTKNELSVFVAMRAHKERHNLEVHGAF